MKVQIAIHKQTSNRYFVLTDTAELKNPETRDWERAVIYTDNVNTYCREQRDFDERFMLVE